MLRLVSHPSETLPLQSPKPRLHETITQLPLTQPRIPLATAQTFPQLPQLFTSTFRSLQPPAQSTCPGGHVAVGVGLEIGVGDALLGVGDALLGVGDALLGVGDALLGVGDALLGAFVTVIVIVWELSAV